MDNPALQMSDAVKHRLKNMSSHLKFVPNLILDIGAYKGIWSQEIKEMFPRSSIFMIEGNEDHRSDLEKTCIPFEIALLADKQKPVIFHKTRTEYSTGNSIYREQTNIFTDNNPLYYKQLCVTKTLGSIASTYNLHPDMIKLDVQGAEKDIILGGVDVVRQCKVIIIEMSISEYNQGSPLMMEMMQFLDHLGFRLYDIVNLLYLPITDGVSLLTQIDGIFVRKDLLP